MSTPDQPGDLDKAPRSEAQVRKALTNCELTQVEGCIRSFEEARPRSLHHTMKQDLKWATQKDRIVDSLYSVYRRLFLWILLQNPSN